MIEDDVNSIPDAELLSRAVFAARRDAMGRRAHRWVCVMDTFALGSTYAKQLCLRFGVDPDEVAK